MSTFAEKNLSFSLALQPSRWMLVYLIALHCVLLVSFYLLPLGWPERLGGSVVVFVHCGYALWRFYYPNSSRSILRLSYCDNGWLLQLADREVCVDLLQATIWSWLVVANFRDVSDGRRYAVVVLPDSASVSQRRQLRVLLRHLPVWGKT